MSEQNCLTCQSFISFADDYFDEKEPSDQGFCSNGKSIYYYNEGAGINIICHRYKRIDNVRSKTRPNI